MKEVNCGETGIARCEQRIRGTDDQEVMRKAAEHSRVQHGLLRMSPEVARKVRAAIHEVS